MKALTVLLEVMKTTEQGIMSLVSVTRNILSIMHEIVLAVILEHFLNFFSFSKQVLLPELK